MATGFGRILSNVFNHTVGSGEVVSESRDVGGFSELAFSGVGHVSITQTGSESLTIEAESNILPLLTSYVSGNQLTIGTEPGVHFTPKRPIRYTLTVKDLSLVRLSGAGNVEIPALGTQVLRVKLSGAGNFSVASLAADAIELTLSGAGSVTCAGQVRRQDVHISGAGSYHGDDLASATANVAISGTGSAHVQVSEQLDARVSGVGSITYSGQPEVRKSVSGIGRISQRG